MQLIYLTEQDLRQIIREETGANRQPNETVKPPVKLAGQKELCTFLNLSEPTIIRWRQNV